tara:strand:+ start:539 stop:973 length:435 start_codon:yes stop_codon:yes gene_type:complete
MKNLKNKLNKWIDTKNEITVNACFWVNNISELSPGMRIDKPDQNKGYIKTRLVQYKDAPHYCDFYRVTKKGTYVSSKYIDKNGFERVHPIHYFSESGDCAYNARTLRPINIKPNDYVMVFYYDCDQFHYNSDTKKYDFGHEKVV